MKLTVYLPSSVPANPTAKPATDRSADRRRFNWPMANPISKPLEAHYGKLLIIDRPVTKRYGIHLQGEW
ncbi:MAG: hypothetical protein A4E65_00072 [Syntrophorhabdus sp. PtaU1.Bin153]|nr:MAG: hypothetical protein A4E65_00072 [Syntrophorhabdus sp. PtaU1.Bin153]